MLSSKRSMVALSLAIAGILLSTSFVIIDHPWSGGPTGNMIIGPKIELTLVNGTYFNSSANVTETVQIMSENPFYLGKGIPPGSYNVTGTSGNPFIVLFNGSFFPRTGYMNQSEFLNSNFFLILLEWKLYFKSLGETNQSVSLEIESSLSVLVDGNLTVYTSYNNIPFNPLIMNFDTYNNNNVPLHWFTNTSVNPKLYSTISLVHTEFNVTPSFDLSNPTISTELNNSSTNVPIASAIQPDKIIGNCNPGTYYEPIKNTILYGPDVLNTVHIATAYNGSVQMNALVIFQLIASYSLELSLNSAQTTLSSGGIYTSQMSTFPSWSGTENLSENSTDKIWVAYPDNITFGVKQDINNTTVIIYLTNATYTITHYNIYYIFGNEYNCHRKYLGNATSMAITAINTTNGDYSVKATFEPIWFYYIYQNLTSGSTPANIGTLAGGQGIAERTVLAHSPGYSNASNAYQTATNAAGVFESGMELGFIIGEVLASVDVLDSTIPMIVSDGIKMITSTLGFAGPIIQDFSTISFSTTLNLGSFMYQISSIPFYNAYVYSLVDYQSRNPVTFIVNGNSYEFSAPSNFIVAS